MPHRYTVTIERIELVSFELDAEDPDDAVERYMTDGDETASKTTSITVESVTH